VIKTYTAGRRLLIGETHREPGEPVPEAHVWFRPDDWAHTGYMHEVEVPEDDFRAAVRKHAPDQEQAILERVGLAEEPKPPAKKAPSKAKPGS